MWECSYCPFASSRKWNTQVHEKRKHQDQISTSNGNGQRQTNEHELVQGGQAPIGYQQHVQEQQTGEQHPLDAVHHHPVQAQQARLQQQGGRVQDLYQQHHRNHPSQKMSIAFSRLSFLDMDYLVLAWNPFLSIHSASELHSFSV